MDEPAVSRTVAWHLCHLLIFFSSSGDGLSAPAYQTSGLLLSHTPAGQTLVRLSCSSSLSSQETQFLLRADLCPFPHHPETSKHMHYPEGEELAVNSQRVFLGHTGASDQNPSQIMLRKTVYVTKESKGPARFGQGPKPGPRSYSSISPWNWFQETRISRS